MSVTLTLANQLADIVSARPFNTGGGNTHRHTLTSQLNTEDMEELRPLVQQFVDEHGRRIARDHDVTITTNYLISNPQGRSGSLPEFFAWMRTNSTGPWATTTTEGAPMLTIQQAEAGIVNPDGLSRDAFVDLRDELTDYLATERYAELCRTSAIRRKSVDQIVADARLNRTSPDFLRWMQTMQRGPWATITPTEGAPMTHAEDILNQLADVPEGGQHGTERRRLTNQLTANDMRPYVDQLRAFTRTGDGSEWSWQDLADRPGNKSRGIPRFARYLRAQGQLPARTAVPQGDTAIAVPAATIDDMRHRYASLTAASIAPWIPLLRRYARESAHADLMSGNPDRTDESMPTQHNSLGNLFVEPNRYPTTLGHNFPDWLETQGITAPTPDRPTVEQFLAYTTEQLRAYEADLAEFLPQSPTHPMWGSDAATARSNAESVVRSPQHYRGTDNNGVLRQLIEAVHAGTYTLLAERTPTTAAAEPGRPVLPTSPRQAFPTIAALRAAYDQWASSTDERLPDQMEAPHQGRPLTGTRTYTRTEVARNGGWSGNFYNEIEGAWEADSFDHERSPYSNGFWRDVRELGFGTPYFDYLGKPTPATPGAQVMPIGPDHPGWNEWWTRLRGYATRDGYMGQFRTLARAMGFAEPTTYQVTLRINANQAQTRDTVIEYIRQHPESLVAGSSRELYAL